MRALVLERFLLVGESPLDGWTGYHMLRTNCEMFACFCKTGVRPAVSRQVARGVTLGILLSPLLLPHSLLLQYSYDHHCCCSYYCSCSGSTTATATAATV
jgi:hypothetical protein